MPKENADAGSPAANGQASLTLTEVAKRTGISMPTLQKYKKRFSDRIPSVGKGRGQRYPEGALDVFRQLRDENMSRRGRPRKDASGAAGGGAAKAAARPRRGAAKGRRRAAAGAAGGGDGEGLLTLTQVAQKTGISYPTLMRYVKTHSDKLPHVGSGRRRRFKPEAVAAFQQLRGESRKGRAPGRGAAAGKRGGRRGRAAAAAAAPAAGGGAPRANGARRGRPPGGGGGGGADAGLQAILKRLEQRLARVEEQLKKPLRIEVRR
jgi:excisionase family DNA binding protein